jgi:hypothetical protein
VNGRLEQIACDELAPHLDEAARCGVERICFTGGEVFVNEDVLRGRSECNEEFLRSLERALAIAPVEILTNARRHIRAHYGALARLRDRYGDRLRLRITLESPEAAGHDALRGRGTFDQTVETVNQLCEMGFTPVITAERPLLAAPGDAEAAAAYRALFARPVEVNLIDNLLEMGHRLTQLAAAGAEPGKEVFVSVNCFDVLGKPPESLMCHFSRCIMKVDGRLRYYPCPVIYDDERFDLGGSLAESWRTVHIAHKNCYDYCLKGGGASCRTRAI